MTGSVSPSEATPLIQNLNVNGNGSATYNNYIDDNGRITILTNGGGGGGATSNNNSQKSLSPYNRLHVSFLRSASTFSEAMTSMKRIGYLGSMSIAVNSLTGPAMYVFLLLYVVLSMISAQSKD
jgi:hypothetical protein